MVTKFLLRTICFYNNVNGVRSLLGHTI